VTADLITFPGAHFVAVPRLPVEDRVTVIEWLAKYETDLAGDSTLAMLRLAAHPSLVGDDLVAAWETAKNAIQIRNETDPDDDDMGWHGRADTALNVLLHGNYGGRAA
jgi:hypothetical protein